LLPRDGGLEAVATGIDLPLRYSIDLRVGDTLCARRTTRTKAELKKRKVNPHAGH